MLDGRIVYTIQNLGKIQPGPPKHPLHICFPAQNRLGLLDLCAESEFPSKLIIGGVPIHLF